MSWNEKLTLLYLHARMITTWKDLSHCNILHNLTAGLYREHFDLKSRTENHKSLKYPRDNQQIHTNRHPCTNIAETKDALRSCPWFQNLRVELPNDVSSWTIFTDQEPATSRFRPVV